MLWGAQRERKKRRKISRVLWSYSSTAVLSLKGTSGICLLTLGTIFLAPENILPDGQDQSLALHPRIPCPETQALPFLMTQWKASSLGCVHVGGSLHQPEPEPVISSPCTGVVADLKHHCRIRAYQVLSASPCLAWCVLPVQVLGEKQHNNSLWGVSWPNPALPVSNSTASPNHKSFYTRLLFKGSKKVLALVILISPFY